jgi:hypothetical protein
MTGVEGWQDLQAALRTIADSRQRYKEQSPYQEIGLG